jgi:hypothetical protein
MMKLPNLAGLEGLLDLDRRGVDIRPTLLRVITDQYLLGRTHTPDEERQFTELALRLIGETDVATRAAVAARLAPHACAPRPIVLQLARDVLAVAEPILRLSPQLTGADLAAIAAERGPSHAAVIARRGQPDPSPPAAAAPPPSPPREPAAPPARTTMPAREGPPTRRVTDTLRARFDFAGLAAKSPAATLKPAEPSAGAGAAELCELFYAAGPLERRLILMSLDYLPTSPPELPGAMQRTDIWRLESAALQHNTEAVVRDLERSLGISRRQARRIVNDEMGEPTVVAAKAMELPADVLQRMLLFMNPRVGQSVDRVYELAALFGDISVEAARRLIAIWRDADPPDAQPAKHDAAWQEAVDHARAALSDITRRAPTRKEAPALAPGERALATDRR